MATYYCESIDTSDGHSCQNPVAVGSTNCAAGHRIKKVRWKEVSRPSMNETLSIVGTIEMEEILAEEPLVPNPPAGFGKRPESREKSLGGTYPELEKYWSDANAVSIFEVTKGDDTTSPTCDWVCPKCKAEFKQTARNVIRDFNRYKKETGTGRIPCTNCRRIDQAERSRQNGLKNGTVAQHPEMLAMWMSSNPIKPDKVPQRSNTFYDWRCITCSKVMHKRTDRLFEALGEGRTGCRSCSKHGFDPEKAGRLYLLWNAKKQLVQVGISNNVSRRFKEHSRNGFVDTLSITEEITGTATEQWEKRILEFLDHNNVPMLDDLHGVDTEKDQHRFDGYSESWEYNDFAELNLGQLMRRVEQWEIREGITPQDAAPIPGFVDPTQSL